MELSIAQHKGTQVERIHHKYPFPVKGSTLIIATQSRDPGDPAGWAAIRKCLEPEGILGIIRIGMEIQTTTTLLEFTSLVSPETYLISEWIIHLKRRGGKPHKGRKDGQRCVTTSAIGKNPIK